jgi:hydrogenase maturation protease
MISLKGRTLKGYFVEMKAKPTLIIGIGNLILTDEGLGVHVVKALEDQALPPDVQLIEGGTATMDLLPALCDAERIIIIDALMGGGEPGAIYRVTPVELRSESARPLSLHQVGFLEVWGMAQQLGARGEVVIIGVEPKEISWGMELTPEVKAALPRVVTAVLEELAEV